MTTSVVDLHSVAAGIVQVTMQDRVYKNGFSPELTAGLQGAFSKLARDVECKVVILTGYDSYFSSGGTQQALLQMQAGQARFTDTDLYTLPLACPIPVIAAMQGHGIGGGFVFGLFADIVILGRERVYTTNFMKYGFTPGMGATYVLPKKLGIALGHEMLLTARSYRGAELAERGVPFTVLPHVEVLEHAYVTARDLADKPRHALVTLKSHLVSELRAQLPSFARHEVAMHAATFTSVEVKDRIHSRFGK